LQDLGMENVVVHSGHLEYFTTIGYILWACNNFVVIWYIFPSFGTLYKQNLATLFSDARKPFLTARAFPSDLNHKINFFESDSRFFHRSSKSERIQP
jgi:hypothetical protein